MTLYEENKRLKAIISSLVPDKLAGPFICGASSVQSNDGLAERYHICPAYGSDVVAIYKRVDNDR